ncbi:glycosyl hydrolase [Fragilaria crotonensis]|nr:glycosyl hydrolase [Fragilaria crotonensis]
MVMNVFFRSVVLTALLQFACATKWKTLDYLYKMTEQGTAVAGVHNKLSQTPASFTNEVTGIAGKAPGLWSGDFLFDYNILHRWAMVHEAKSKFQSGAIVNIM